MSEVSSPEICPQCGGSAEQSMDTRDLELRMHCMTCGFASVDVMGDPSKSVRTRGSGTFSFASRQGVAWCNYALKELAGASMLAWFRLAHRLHRLAHEQGWSDKLRERHIRRAGKRLRMHAGGVIEPGWAARVSIHAPTPEQPRRWVIHTLREGQAPAESEFVGPDPDDLRLHAECRQRRSLMDVSLWNDSLGGDDGQDDGDGGGDGGGGGDSDDIGDGLDGDGPDKDWEPADRDSDLIVF